MTNIPLCFIDTEFDRLHARQNRQAWDVAIIRREPDGTETESQFFVSGLDFRDSDPGSLRLGGWYGRYKMDHQANQRPDIYLAPRSAAQEIERHTRGAQLVGCVPSADEEIFFRLLHEHGLPAGWHHRLRCVETLAFGWLSAKGIDLPPLDGKSDDLFALVGIDTKNYDRHTALGDATLARDVWDAVMGSKHQTNS